MKRSALPRHRDLFEEPSSTSVITLPKIHRAEAIHLLSKLLSEVVDARRDRSADTDAGDDQDQQ
jgi:hypothetical protein